MSETTCTAYEHERGRCGCETLEEMRARIAAEAKRKWGEGGYARELLREEIFAHPEDYSDE